MGENKYYSQNTLQQLHQVQTEILDEIVRICDLHQLRYCLIGGTLLGAVRHKGFIPWDDDLDIAMPRVDFEKFCDLCKEHLNEKYYLHFSSTDKQYWLSFAKIRKKNTLFDEKNIAHIDVPKGIFVDIFPLDYAVCEQSASLKLRTRIIKSLDARCTGRILGRKSSGFKGMFMRLFPMPVLRFIQLKLMKASNKKGGDYYINFGSNYNTVKQTIPCEKYEPYIKLEFEGRMYNAPRDYDYVLRRIFEDYMQLPPPEKRITHMPLSLVFDTHHREADI